MVAIPYVGPVTIAGGTAVAGLYELLTGPASRAKHFHASPGSLLTFNPLVSRAQLFDPAQNTANGVQPDCTRSRHWPFFV